MDKEVNINDVIWEDIASSSLILLNKVSEDLHNSMESDLETSINRVYQMSNNIDIDDILSEYLDRLNKKKKESQDYLETFIATCNYFENIESVISIENKEVLEKLKVSIKELSNIATETYEHIVNQDYFNFSPKTISLYTDLEETCKELEEKVDHITFHLMLCEALTFNYQ